MNLAPHIAIAQLLASVVLPHPDLIIAWDAAPEPVDFYEVQAFTNLMRPPQVILITNATALPVFIADAPHRFFRVRDWRGVLPSDWASVKQFSTNN